MSRQPADSGAREDAIATKRDLRSLARDFRMRDIRGRVQALL
jgi:hypothetical protein